MHFQNNSKNSHNCYSLNERHAQGGKTYLPQIPAQLNLTRSWIPETSLKEIIFPVFWRRRWNETHGNLFPNLSTKIIMAFKLKKGYY